MTTTPHLARKGAHADTGNAGHFAAKHLSDTGTDADLSGEGMQRVSVPGNNGTFVVGYKSTDGTMRTCNGPDGEPGRSEFDAAGRLISRTFYDENGQVHSGPQGEAATEDYYPDGTLRTQYRVEHGKYVDGPDGEPGWSAYYEDGTVQSVGHYRDGVLHDAGEIPAVASWHPDGKIADFAHYQAGRLHSEGKIPTQEIYDASGRLRERTFYTAGNLTDRGPGMPARAVWSAEGRLLRAEYWDNGKLRATRYL